MSNKMYFIKYQDETIEEAIFAHGGTDSGYKSLDDAIDSALTTGDDVPFIILDCDMKVVYREPDYAE